MVRVCLEILLYKAWTFLVICSSTPPSLFRFCLIYVEFHPPLLILSIRVPDATLERASGLVRWLPPGLDAIILILSMEPMGWILFQYYTIAECPLLPLHPGRQQECNACIVAAD